MRTATRIAPPTTLHKPSSVNTPLSLAIDPPKQGRGGAGTRQRVSVGSNKWLEGPTVSNTTTIFKTCGQQTGTSPDTRPNQLVTVLRARFTKLSQQETRQVPGNSHQDASRDTIGRAPRATEGLTSGQAKTGSRNCDSFSKGEHCQIPGVFTLH